MIDRERPTNLRETPADPGAGSAMAGAAAFPVGPTPGAGRSRSAAAADVRPPAAAPDVADLGRVRAVIDALPEAVFVTESDGDVRLTNPAADRLFAGRPVVDRSDLLARFEGAQSTFGEGPFEPTAAPVADPGPVTVRSREEPTRWFTLREVALDGLAGDPDADPGTAAGTGSDETATGRTIFVVRDVTDTRDLRPVREAFLAVLSHELRTPITTIYAGSSVLARRAGLSPSATRTLAADISAEAARLYDLVEDLLVLARLERRVLEPHDEPVLIQRSIDATLRLIAGRLGEVPIVRRGDIDVPPVHGDATYVDQACRDLVMASLRYAAPEPGRELVVDVRSDPAVGEVRVAVLDRGPALDRDELPRAFELPGDSAVGRLAGSGVGPFVCRQLVESMGGRVWARNRPGGGLEMGFALRADQRR